jgi:hypothetical protein
LKERQTRTSITDEKLKRRLFHRKRKVFSTEVPHQYQILLYQEGIKNHPTTDQNLIKERVQAINDVSEWFVKNPSCEEVEVLHQDVYSMGKWDRRSNIIIPKKRLNKT